MTDDLKDIESENTESNDELFERFAITIDKGQDALRIDKFLMQRIENATRNKLQRAIAMGMVQVNGKEVKSNYKIKHRNLAPAPLLPFSLSSFHLGHPF